jgi:hypothetical protein
MKTHHTALRLRYLKCGYVDAMIRYDKRIVHYSNDAIILAQNPLHPSRPQMESWLQAVPRDTLRWQVNTRPTAMKLKKAVLRTALQGKWYKLMCRAFEQRGYRPDGRQIATGEKGLSGTMEIIVRDGRSTLLEPEPEHLRRCLKIVDALEGEQR